MHEGGDVNVFLSPYGFNAKREVSCCVYKWVRNSAACLICLFQRHCLSRVGTYTYVCSLQANKRPFHWDFLDFLHFCGPRYPLIVSLQTKRQSLAPPSSVFSTSFFDATVVNTSCTTTATARTNPFYIVASPKMSLSYMPASPSHPLPFYTTTTTTLRTTTSATIGAVIHLTFPTPLTPIVTSYTTPPIPDSPTSKAYPYGLPILVLTELDAMVYDPLGKEIVSTVTTVQAAPRGVIGDANDGGKVDRDEYLRNAWSEWTEAERASVIAGIVLALVFTIGMLLWCCCRSKAWGTRGGRKRRRSGMREKNGWRGKKNNRVEKEDEVMKDVELEYDARREAAGKDIGVSSAKRIEGLPEISIIKESPETVRQDPSLPPANGGLQPAVELYQMSGALQVPRSPSRSPLRSPVSAVQAKPERLRGIEIGSEISRGRISTYRAMRAREKREERARAYVQEPVYACGQQP